MTMMMMIFLCFDDCYMMIDDEYIVMYLIIVTVKVLWCSISVK